jgi:DNA polymerase-3 subunit gamma/tau
MMLWQMALQGMAEVKKSDAPLQALEMVLIRLCYARELPDPGSLMKYLKGDAGAVTVPSLSSSSVVPQRPAMAATPVALASYEELVELCTARRQPRLSYLLRHQIRCVKFQNGAMEIILPADVPGTLPNDLAAQLLEWTGERWVISLATVVENAPLTLAEKAEQQQQEQQQRLQTHPLVAAALKAFPGARIVS